MATRVSVTSVPNPDPSEAPVRVSKVKLANDRPDRRAEAKWLDEVRHSGVARLHAVTEEPFTIITDHAGGSTLRTARLEPAEAALTLAAVADILADLHAADRAHGKLTLDHIVIGSHGPVLCSPHGLVSEAEADLTALGRCMTDLQQQWADRDSSQPAADAWSDLAAKLGSGDQSLSAQRAARQLRALSEPEPQVTVAAGPPRSFRGLALAAIVVLLGFGGVAVVGSTSADADDGVQVLINNKLYEVGREGSSAVALATPCDPGSPVLVLDPESSIVWRFPEVGDSVEAVAFATVPGATDLRVRLVASPNQPDQTCEVAVATGPAGATVLETWLGKAGS